MISEVVIIVLALVAVGSVWRGWALGRRLSAEQRQASIARGELEAARRRGEGSASRLEAFLSATEDAIVIAQRGGGSYPLNAAARALFGTQTDFQSCLALTQSAELESLLTLAQHSPTLESPIIGEIVLRAFRDRVMQVLISHASASDEYVILLRDVTDLRRLETVRRDFVANVSHELRTPLSSIKAMAETLLDGAIDDEEVARHFLATIVREADRLVRLAADLLDLSRVEMQPVMKEDHDVAALIDDIMMRFESQRLKAGVALVLDVERPLIAACDADEISQVLLNLIDNAIKYTPRGGVIEVNAHRRKNRITVEIADTGIGILQQDIPRLFERFYRTDKARSRQSGGTGLGLSIVKHIVERHGGELWVRSEYNRGSTFGFSLPRPREDDSLSARFERLEAAFDERRRNGNGVIVVGGAAPSEANTEPFPIKSSSDE